MAAPWAPAAKDGLHLQVRLTPRGGRDALDGLETLADGRQVLKLRVAAAPSEGEANAALLALLAKLLAVPRSRLALIAGASARLKTVEIRGDASALAARLQDLVDASRTSRGGAGRPVSRAAPTGIGSPGAGTGLSPRCDHDDA